MNNALRRIKAIDIYYRNLYEVFNKFTNAIGLRKIVVASINTYLIRIGIVRFRLKIKKGK